MYKLINVNNNVICSSKESISFYHITNNLSSLNNGGLKFIGISINGKLGVISQVGKIIVPCEYNDIKLDGDFFVASFGRDDLHTEEDIFTIDGVIVCKHNNI